jgi:protein TonB
VPKPLVAPDDEAPMRQQAEEVPPPAPPMVTHREKASLAPAESSKPSPAPAQPRSRPARIERDGDSGGSGEGNSPAHYIRKPSAPFPAAARSRGWEGRVLVRIKVGADGSCGQASVERSSGHDMLDEAALDAVCNGRYAPKKQNGRPVDGWITIPFDFKLDK